MKYFVSLLFFSLFIVSVFPNELKEDELLRRLAVSEGEDRLKTLHTLQQHFLYEPKDKYYNQLLLEEAIKQSNAKYTAIALSSQTVYHYRDFNTDSVFYYADIAMKFDLEHKQYRPLFQVKDILVRRYIEKGHFSLGLKSAFEMKEEAARLNDSSAMLLSSIALAYAYLSLGQPDEAIRYIREGLNAYIPNPEAPYQVLQGYAILISAYMNKGDNENVFLYTDSLCNEIQFIHENFPVFNLKDFEVACALHMAYFYSETGQLDEAWELIQQGDEMIKGGDFPFYRFQSNSNKMRYYRAKGDYENCWRYYQICYDFCKENNLESDMRNLLRFRAQTLNMIGQYDSSSQTYSTLLSHIDSVNKERFTYEIGQMRTEYELDRKEDKIAHQQERIKSTTRLNIMLIAAILLLLFLSYLIIRNLVTSKKKNLSMFTQMVELTKTKKELTGFKDMMQSRLPSSADSTGDTPEDRLFKRIENFMKTEKPYTQTVYGRKELVIDMNTNEVYLAKAIRKGANLTVHEYINQWRMEYAKQLLLENTNLTIEAIAHDAGFSSIRNFYRLFKEQYDMSPAEFRNYVIESYNSNR